jgi:hypothetical protein
VVESELDEEEDEHAGGDAHGGRRRVASGIGTGRKLLDVYICIDADLLTGWLAVHTRAAVG